MHLDFGAQESMSAAVIAMLSTPLLLRAKHVRISADPGLGLHEAAALRTALTVFDEEGAVLASIVTLVANLLSHSSIPDGLSTDLD